MRVDPDRIRQDVEVISSFTATPGSGASRPTFSPPWRAALDYVAEEARRCDCSVRVDAAGNLLARRISWNEPAWLSGSHLDTVPHGGNFDGVAGVVAPLEVLRTSDVPLELVVFAEEEGTTFGRGMLGSHAWAGNVSSEDLGRLRNEFGESYLEAGRQHGVIPAHIGVELLRPNAIRGFVEVHIEQGPGLWKRDEPLALVTAIAGRRQLRVRVSGWANHAGSTAMADRRDALAGASDMIVRLEALAPSLSAQTVITVGRIECLPNAVNVIPGEVTFTIDFRSPDEAVLLEGSDRIEEIVQDIARRRGLDALVELTESLAPTPMDPALCDAIRAIRDRLPESTSGALHDAAILAPLVPTAMLFVASRDGISHNPAEFSRIEDIAAAAEILLELFASR